MFFDQFSRLCTAHNTNPTKFVTDVLHLSSSKVTAWKNGSIPKYEILNTIAGYFNVSVGTLFDGIKDSSTDQLTADEQELIDVFKKLSPKSQGQVKERAIVLLELETPTEPVAEEESEEQETIFIEFATLKASAGTGEQLIDDPERDVIEVVKNEITMQAKFAIQIHGDSMEPEYSDGEIVLVKTQPQINVGQIGIFTVNDMGYIKKLGTDRLISINPEYDDIYFEEGQDIRCKGLVIGTLESDDFV